MEKLAVVILNWNGKKWLQKFLKIVCENSLPHSVYVIDNNSTDDSVSYIKEEHSTVKCIVLEQNYGFADGYNRGLEQIKAEYYVLLNSDVEVTPNWIRPVLDLFETDTSIAAIQPKIKDYNHRQKFEYAGGAGGMMDFTGVPFCRGRIFEHIEDDHGQYDNVSSIFWASGASLFIRSSVYWEVGGLDADFFAHMEEIDLCWRIQNKGYQILFCPDSTVYHVGGGTLNKLNPHKYFLNFRNSLWMLQKNLPSKYLVPVLFLRMCLDGLAALKLGISNPKMIWIVLKAHLSFYATILKTHKKRKFNTSFPSSIYKKSIIIDFYIRKINQYNMLGR
ncbi:MAG: glycosyltransferase family 2 protein [Cytophagales bacterium]